MICLISIFALFHGTNPSVPVLTCLEVHRVNAITEEENEISMRDASSTKERPRLKEYDMDEDVVSDIEVNHFL